MRNLTPHNQPGHLNIYELDHESTVTGRGQHDRVVVFLPDHEGLYCRVDHLHGLGMPTEKEILAVAKAWPNNIRGRWILSRTEKHSDGNSTDLFFEKVDHDKRT